MTVNSFHITQITPDQLSVLREISIQTFLDTYGWGNSQENIDAHITATFSEVQLLKELNDPNCLFYFISKNQTHVGYLKCNLGPAQTELNDINSLEIERIYVIKEFHGQKIGVRLLEKAKEVAIDLALTYIWLGVWEQNPKAIRFYQRNGYETFGTHTFTVGGEAQNDLLMKLDVNDKAK